MKRGKMAAYMISGMKIEGRSRFNKILVRGSKTEYETKKMDSVALYRPVDILWRLFCKPSILAFPIFVRSRKARR